MVNWRLWLGMILIAFLMFIALFGPMLSPYDTEAMQPTGYYDNSQGESVLVSAPFPPSKEHLFGTDTYGHDILTLLLYGAKYTIFASIITAILRILIGGAFGIVSGIHNEKEKSGSNFGMLGSIPVFIIIYFIMAGIVINSEFSVMELIIIQTSLMTAVGIPGVYAVVYSKTKELKKNLFVTAANALGAGSIHLAFKHLFPHLKGTLMVMFVKEIILVLSLIGQLGIFDLFLGGTIMRAGGGSVDYLSITHEWAGLIGQWRSFIYYYQWIILYPLLAFILVIFSFYMLARGLELKDKYELKKYPHI